MKRKLFFPWGTLMLAVVAAFALSSCGSQTPREFNYDSAYDSWISAFTSNSISRTSTIKLRLNEEAVDAAKIGNVLSSSPLTFSPAIPGEAVWIDKWTLEYRPSEPLPSGTYYQASFPLKDFYEEVPEELSDFNFSFETRPQNFEVFVHGMKSMDDKKLKWQLATGSLVTADFEQSGIVEQLLAASQNNKPLKIKWTHSLDGITHGFMIDSLPRKTDPSFFTLNWDGAPLSIDQSGEKQVEIPAIGDFKLLRVETFNDPDQYILLTFSDPVSKKQNLKGLITLEENKVRTVVKGSEIKVYPKSHVSGDKILKISEGVRNILGHKIKNPKDEVITFEELNPEIRLVGSGNILPRSKNKLPFAFETVNLSAVQLKVFRIFEDNVLQFLQVNDFEGDRELYRVGKEILNREVRLDDDKNVNLKRWTRHVIDLSKLIKAEPGAIYRVTLNFNYRHSLYDCPDQAEANEDEEENEASEEDEYGSDEENSYWDFAEDYYNEYNSWEYRDDPCKPAFYSYNSYQHKVSRNILASDLGILAKKDSRGRMLFAVNDLLNTDPINGVKLELYDFTQQLIGTATTDAEGMAMIEPQESPYVLVAKSGKQRGYMKVDDGHSLSLSQFDITGRSFHQGIKGYLYGDRGVWRPGDTLYLSFMLEDREGSLPKDHPVTFKFYDPRDQVVKTITTSKHLNHVYTFPVSTKADAPTGNYRASISVGGATFDKTLKVETVVPNRLKINIDFGKESLSAKDTEINGKLSSRWLHGAIAKNLTADVSVNLRQARTRFKTYTDYTYDDPVRTFESERQVVFEGQLDEEGNADIPLDVSVSSEAPGMLRANFVTKVFEPGGNFSSDRFSIPYYPYDRFVGIKLPKGDKTRGMLLTDKKHKVSFVSMSPEGKLIDGDSLTVSLYQLDWRWWWDQSSNNISSYNGNFYRSMISEGKVATKGGKGTYTFEVKYPQWGRYLMRACDGEGHCTGKIFYMDWPGWAGRARKDQPGGASMLTFTSDKKKYKVGESITLNIPTGKEGRALISIETGRGVLETHWLEATGETTQFSFTATKEMSPNIYANVSLIQPHSQTSNDLPSRLYGVVPIEVEDPQTIIKPVIRMADVLRPEKKVSIKVSESQGKAMTYTVAVVDEGLLDLTRFKTPNPRGEFYAREALDVKTWDLYDNVLGSLGAELGRLLAIGGDDDGTRAKEGSKMNRFRPVVKFMGPFRLEPGQTRSHNFKMPNYIGSVRTMVVARQEEAYGSVEHTSAVRKPLMVLGSLPRVLGPNESVKLPVTVFAMEEHIKNVSVTLETNDLLQIEGESKKSLRFAKTGDDLVTFDLKVKPQIGVGTVKVIAKSGKETATYFIDIDVRSPNPRVTNVQAGLVDAGKLWQQDFSYPGMAGTNKGILEVSSIPPLNLGKRLGYLLRYPHGCIEQTTSSVFPQVYLTHLLRLDKKTKDKIDGNIKAGIDRLKLFQTANGGLAYWPGGNESHDWGSNYGGNFLVHAKLAGYHVPQSMLSKWIKFQGKRSRDWDGKMGGTFKEIHGDLYHTEFIQVDRLYLLALAGKPELGSMNRLREAQGLKTVSKWRLAAAYKLAGQPEVAKKIVQGLDTSVEPYSELSGTFGTALRDKAIILECLAVLKMKSSGGALIQEISRNLSSEEWHSTQTTGYCLTAMGILMSNEKEEKTYSFSYSLNGGKAKDYTSNKPITQIEIDPGTAMKGSLEFKNKSGRALYARMILNGIPAQGDRSSQQNGISMAVRYLDLDGGEIDPSQIEQGTDFIAEVSVKNPGTRGNLDELALNQIFPSGWEIHNTRLDNLSFGSGVDQPEYQDIRDDRVYSYFDLIVTQNNPWWYWHRSEPVKDTKTFQVLLNATYQGRFYLPTVYVEAMYDAEISARVPGKWVEVTGITQ